MKAELYRIKIKFMKTSEKIKLFIIAFVFGIVGGVVAYWIIPLSTTKNVYVVEKENTIPDMHLTNGNSIMELPDFTVSAEVGLHSVVHIRTEYYSGDPINNLLYGKPSYNEPLRGSGSGVIISQDGYIVTNNHVIDNAANISVTLNDKREFSATLIGHDPTTDLALLKIDADSLKFLAFGNSDDLKVGEWVLAIGNPFNLTSTVTAGIVSAKARDISILKQQQYAIESFIQTDAAVNPGNSGGALININGMLVGINTAIASPTGSYTGYSFAVPSSIVQKVVADFLKYGSVQRAYLGVKIANIDEDVATRFDLPDLKGIYISNVTDDGAAAEGGVLEGDVILKFEGIDVNEVSELLDLIGRHSPGDIVTMSIRRNNKIKDVELTLTNIDGETKVIVDESVGTFGATFEDLTKDEKRAYNLKNGVKVDAVSYGKFLTAGIKEGFIIVKINDKKMKTADDVVEILGNSTGGIYIEGFDPRTGTTTYYAFGTE